MEPLPNRLISMLTDYGFKVTFGNERDHTFLRNALPILLKLPLKIRHIKHLPTEIVGKTESARKGFYDTFFRVNKELYFITEMQLGNHTYLLERLMFYLSFVFISRVPKGKEAFKDVKKVHCICITRDTLFPNTPEYYHKSNFRSETGMLISDKMELIFVELEKFTKLASELDNEFEELLFTMKNAHTIDLEDRAKVPAFWKKSWYSKTMKELNLSKMSAENRLIYELAWARIAATAYQEEMDRKARDAERDAERDTERDTERDAERDAELKVATIVKALKRGKLNIEEIAEDNDVSIDFVLEVKAKMAQNQSN